MTDWQAVVVGTGMMGPGIAATLVLGGSPTILVSRTPEGAEQGLSKAFKTIIQLQENGLVSQEQSERAKLLLTSSADLERNLSSAHLVIESIPEDLSLKQDFFHYLDKITGEDAILASNTSGLSITAIVEKVRFPERVLTTHFWNPPHLMPLVEVIMGKQTSEAIALKTVDLFRKCGKTAILVRKDRPGQLGNRLQHALIREAIHIVEEGLASPEDVDLAVKAGFGLRLPVWGVFEHADAVGLDLVRSVQDYVVPDLNNQPHAPELLKRKVENGELGAKTGQGFYDWTARDIEAAKALRDAFIIQFLRDREKFRNLVHEGCRGNS